MDTLSGNSSYTKMVYIGPSATLAKKTALVLKAAGGMCLAQFDDLSTGMYAQGWTSFPSHYFVAVYAYSAPWHGNIAEDVEAIKPELLGRRVSEW